MRTSYYMKMSAKHWAWSPTSGHCRLYFSLKKVSKKLYSCIGDGINESKTSSPAPAASQVANKSYNKKPRTKTKYCIRCESRSTLNSSFCYEQPRKLISTEAANDVIWQNEKTVDFDSSKVIKCETNQLASNSPNEDQLFISRSCFNNTCMFGVLDGHGGNTLAEFTRDFLPYYLHLSIENKKNLIQTLQTESIFQVQNILAQNNDSVLRKRWKRYIHGYALDIVKNAAFSIDAGNILTYVTRTMQQMFSTNLNELDENIDIAESVKNAFKRFDADIVNEIRYLSENGLLNPENINLALSGCCGLVAYIKSTELFIANSGDCRAVLGSYENGNWSAVQLSTDHTAMASPAEVSRILSEHPLEEARTCIQYGRLLGRLAPLRAFGDIPFKLKPDELNKILSGFPKYKPINSVRTPPYLTAEPEVFHYNLGRNDKFIILASDGLWDMLSNEEVVELVAAYQEGNAISVLKERAHLFGVPNADYIISDPNAFMETADENVASFLIRCALGGFDEQNLKSMLSLKHPEVRFYRDDISIMVIFLDPNINEETPDLVQ